MKPLFLINLLFSALFSMAGNKIHPVSPQGPNANAGPNQTIYLTQTSTATLDGSASSSGSYQWTEVSTDYSSGANIVSPNSAVTDITGLSQGTWYFQLAVTSGGATSTSIAVVKVDYDVPPSGGSLIHSFQMADNSSVINDRHDTVSYFPVSDLNYGQSGNDPNHFYLFRDRLNGLKIDNQNGKMYSTIQDGYESWDGFPRSEIGLANNDFTIDTSHTYVFEWKGYFPQNYNYLTSWYRILTMLQIHSSTQVATVWQIDLDANGNLINIDTYDNGSGLVSPEKTIGTLSSFYNNTHTLRLTMREGKGYPGQTAFIQLEVDGKTVCYRNTGQVGSYSWDDYVKFGGLYDWNNAMVNGSANNHNRKFQLVTEAFNVYQLGNNQPPTANAGSNQTIVLPTNNVSLNGSGNSSNSSISGYKWTQISGPSSSNIDAPYSSNTNVSGLVKGTYKFQLQVTDDNGETGTATMQVTVKSATNTPPTANAGSDQTITLPINSASISGSGTDSDGSISSYLWTKISGPSGSTIANPNSASTSVSGLKDGVYQFQLQVTDNGGATGNATMKVTVNSAPNKAPTAKTGADQTITLPTNSVSISGTGTDSDGSISSYLWTKISGPSGSTISSSNSASTSVSGLKDGVYQFQLQVTDNDGATGTATMKVTVNSAANKAPTAKTGADQTITLPTNSVSITGSGTDSDGNIVSYLWVKKTGPSGGVIGNPSTPTTIVSNLTSGVYQFELTVTDNQGATGSATIQITVKATDNIPPVAVAGSSQTISLPASSINLAGSGTDPDGTIASYSWAKIKGPAGINIVNPNSANSVVSGLVQGVYQFELTVTDNKGATGKDTIQVNVNAANNIPPVAVAGSNQTITLPTNTVNLAGSGTDADGTIKSYEWSEIKGPAGATIANPNSANTTVAGLVQGTYQFELQVTDNKGDVGKDSVSIKVKAANNEAPVANAGSNQVITLPTNSVSLAGSGSDADGTIVAYSWTLKAGAAGTTISLPSSSSTTVKGLTEGDYTFELTVTDNQGATGTDTVHIKVNPAINIAPTANAGSNQAVTLPTHNVTLRGSGTDPDGTIASYSWAKIKGPAGINIVNPNSANSVVSGLVQGVYQFELTVTDNKGATGKDTIQVNVNAANNIPPVAVAGSNQTITLPTNTVNLAGSGTDADGTIKSYEWSEIKGPAGATIANPNSANTTVAGLVQGTYQFELQVTDNKGDVGKDSVSIKVKAANNEAPVANAGSNQVITLPTNSVSLAGSGSDADGTIVAYSWTLKAGAAGTTISLPSSSSTTVKGLTEGDYTFELTVTDNQGATGTDTVHIKVNPAINIAPTANAGSNQAVTLPTHNVTLRGSGTDPDGTIASYSWAKIKGPAGINIVNPNSANSVVSGLVQGVYQFELTVTDNKGATGKDTIQVNVNAANNIPPVAVAGSNQTITLPTNTVNLAGSGTDADGTIKSYEWSEIKGPAGATIANPNSANTTVAGLVQGTYQFELQVTDNKGDVGKDTIQVNVNGPLATQQTKANIAPSSDAGNDITTVTSDNSVTLNGKGSDVDGTISSYSWSQISGPSVSTIISSDSANTNVESLIEGTYEFELQVKDNDGAVGKDTMQVTVGLERLAPENFTGNLKVYPNPVHTITNLEVNTGRSNTNVMIVITDMSGKIVYKNQFVSSSNNVHKEIDMSNLIKGVYSISVYFDGMIKSSIKVIRL